MSFLTRLYDPDPATGAGGGGGGEANPPAGAAGAAPAAVAPATGAAPAAGTPTAFKIPEKYLKDENGNTRAFYEKIKSEEDLHSALINAQKIIGKKYVPFDFANATEEAKKEYLSAQRPEAPTAYDFFDAKTPEADREIFQKMFWENGVSKSVAQKLTEQFRAIEQKRMAEAVSAEGLVKILKESFGEDYQQRAGKAALILKSLVSSDTDKVLVDQGVNNEYLGFIYRLMDSVQEKFGISEKDLALKEPAGGTGATDLVTKRAEIRKKINELSSRNHTADEKKVLLDQLSATYK
jgi:hypothetical protein